MGLDQNLEEEEAAQHVMVAKGPGKHDKCAHSERGRTLLWGSSVILLGRHCEISLSRDRGQFLKDHDRTLWEILPSPLSFWEPWLCPPGVSLANISLGQISPGE